MSFRTSISSLREQAAASTPPQLVRCAARLCGGDEVLQLASTRVTPRLHQPEEEIAYGPACWLWDYLRRSGGWPEMALCLQRALLRCLQRALLRCLQRALLRCLQCHL